MIISQLNLSLICFFLNENLPRVYNSNFSYPVHDLNLSMSRITFTFIWNCDNCFTNKIVSKIPIIIFFVILKLFPVYIFIIIYIHE